MFLLVLRPSSLRGSTAVYPGSPVAYHARSCFLFNPRLLPPPTLHAPLQPVSATAPTSSSPSATTTPLAMPPFLTAMHPPPYPPVAAHRLVHISFSRTYLLHSFVVLWTSIVVVWTPDIHHYLSGTPSAHPHPHLHSHASCRPSMAARLVAATTVSCWSMLCWPPHPHSLTLLSQSSSSSSSRSYRALYIRLHSWYIIIRPLF